MTIYSYLFLTRKRHQHSNVYEKYVYLKHVQGLKSHKIHLQVESGYCLYIKFNGSRCDKDLTVFTQSMSVCQIIAPEVRSKEWSSSNKLVIGSLFVKCSVFQVFMFATDSGLCFVTIHCKGQYPLSCCLLSFYIWSMYNRFRVFHSAGCSTTELTILTLEIKHFVGTALLVFVYM